MKLLNDYILVDIFDEEETTKSGIIVNKRSIEGYRKGKVLETSCTEVPTGAVVLFRKFSDDTYKYERLQWFVKFKDLLCIE